MKLNYAAFKLRVSWIELVVQPRASDRCAAAKASSFSCSALLIIAVSRSSRDRAASSAPASRPMRSSSALKERCNNVEFESKVLKPGYHNFRFKTRRFQAMGKLNSTCSTHNLYSPALKTCIAVSDPSWSSPITLLFPAPPSPPPPSPSTWLRSASLTTGLPKMTRICASTAARAWCSRLSLDDASRRRRSSTSLQGWHFSPRYLVAVKTTFN